MSAERCSEQSRRNARAQQRAFAELRDRHPDEYREAYARIKAEIYAECGELPELPVEQSA